MDEWVHDGSMDSGLFGSRGCSMMESGVEGFYAGVFSGLIGGVEMLFGLREWDVDEVYV